MALRENTIKILPISFKKNLAPINPGVFRVFVIVNEDSGLISETSYTKNMKDMVLLALTCLGFYSF